MASITIRNLDNKVKAKLRLQAARNGRSMEQEVREILRASLIASRTMQDLAKAIRARFQPLGGVELELPKREPLRASPFERA